MYGPNILIKKPIITGKIDSPIDPTIENLAVVAAERLYPKDTGVVRSKGYIGETVIPNSVDPKYTAT